MKVEMENTPPGHDSPAATGPKTWTVLIADDDPEVRLLLCSALPRGLRAVEARSGIEAIRLARELVPSLMVCDAQMPGLPAQDMIAALRQDAATAGIPLLVTSGSPDEESILATSKPFVFLQKPFVIEEFQKLVQETLSAQAGPG